MTLVKRFSIFTVSILCIATLATSSYAEIKARICNKDDAKIYLAVAGFDKRAPTLQWMSIGWYFVEAGQCKDFVFANLMPQHLFYLATHSTDGSVWGGKFLYCINEPDSFEILGDRNCSRYGNSYSSKGFGHHSNHDGSYSINFKP